MKAQHSDQPEATLYPTDRGNIRFSHPWIYKSQIKNLSKELKPGSEVLVKSPKGSLIGVGYYNPKSEIAIRVLCREKRTLDKEFFVRRLKAAAAYRRSLKLDSNAVRWVNSESDQLPGLVIDQYANTAVVQFLTLGMDMRRDRILESIVEVLKPERIYERSDGTYRGLEGLEIRKGWLRGSGSTKVEIHEGPVKYWVDVENGHKTGFYLDQRDSRAFLRRMDWAGKKVLDCFTYTGGFAVSAAKSGAAKVIGLDLSETALELAKENAALNGVTTCEFVKENTFDYLRRCEETGETFDAVILDPPSFVRAKAMLDKAEKGYKEIHLRALKILKPGGVLLTFCCSYHLGMEAFQKVVVEASRDARCGLKVLDWFYQAKDHPVSLNIPETLYLKGLALQAITY